MKIIDFRLVTPRLLKIMSEFPGISSELWWWQGYSNFLVRPPRSKMQKAEQWFGVCY